MEKKQFFTAMDRVDFRKLIVDCSCDSILKLNGLDWFKKGWKAWRIGSCGRELCSTWLTDFRVVTTSAARYQQLSLNLKKLPVNAENQNVVLTMN